MRHGSVYRIADFVERVLGRKENPSSGNAFARSTMIFLKEMDTAQSKNSWITLAPQTGDGIWLYYKGLRQFQFFPAKSFIRVIISRYGPHDAQRLQQTLLRHHRSKSEVFRRMPMQYSYHQWRLQGSGLPVIEQFVEGLRVPRVIHSRNDIEHSRYFPAEDRQAAMNAFERDGRKCPGFAKRKPHKVGKDDRIEFDHLIPYGRGGSSSVMNIQVLCMACNRAKAMSIG